MTSQSERWGEGRDEFPLRDMRWSCPGCRQIKAFSQGELCEDCKKRDPDVAKAVRR